MSFYRTFITAIAAMGLATAAIAAKTNTNATQTPTQQTATQQASDPAQAEKININKATAKELAKVKGLSGAKAKAIVAYRKKNGDFKSLDDLKQVKGFKRMNEQNMKEIQDQLML